MTKWELGRRLALLALYNDYGHEFVPSGPLFKSFTIEADSIFIDFAHKGTGLVAKGDSQLHGFAIAGDDGKYVWADNPNTINPYNKEGLTASPFSTH
jgi:sialate O-acetylesterase